MPSVFVPPEYGLSAFNCPRCGAYAQQKWSELRTDFPGEFPEEGEALTTFPNGVWTPPIQVAFCARCKLARTGTSRPRCPGTNGGRGGWWCRR